MSVRSHTDPLSLKGKDWGRQRLSTVRASRSSEVSPPHNVTNPSGLTLLHTPPSPSFHGLRQMSEDPSPGSTTGKDGDGVGSSSHSFSHHYFTLVSPTLSPSAAFFYLLRASGYLCSFCDYRSFTRVSPRHTPHVTLPSATAQP